MTLFALHGFLGTPGDWNCFNIQLHAVDILGLSPPKEGFWRWARAFNAYVRRVSQAPRHLMGYSLGARLAMHALLDQPELWVSAVLISGHPGLKSEVEKKEKMQQDASWAERFLEEPWENLMQQWQAQPLFASSAQLLRKENDYERSLLAEALKGFSLGLQEDLRDRLLEAPPQLWIAGACDGKFAAIARDKENHWIAPHAGHRVPWDCPKEFLKRLSEFIKEKEDAFATRDLAGN